MSNGSAATPVPTARSHVVRADPRAALTEVAVILRDVRTVERSARTNRVLVVAAGAAQVWIDLPTASAGSVPRIVLDRSGKVLRTERVRTRPGLTAAVLARAAFVPTEAVLTGVPRLPAIAVAAARLPGGVLVSWALDHTTGGPQWLLVVANRTEQVSLLVDGAGTVTSVGRPVVRPSS